MGRSSTVLGQDRWSRVDEAGNGATQNGEGTECDPMEGGRREAGT